MSAINFKGLFKRRSAPQDATGSKADAIQWRDAQNRSDGLARALAAFGYGNHGASTTKNSMLGWLTGQGSAEEDIDLNASKLRERARDLDAGGGLARGAVRRLRTTIVGSGLIPKPRIDAAILGLSPDVAAQWEMLAKAEFISWANSRECDATGVHNFFELQSEILLAMLISGDAFVMLPALQTPATPYQLRIRVLEADRVCTQDSGGDSQSSTLENGNRVIDGIEVDTTGRVVAYWIASRHPFNDENSQTELTWERVDAYGTETGMPNVLHPYEAERPEQHRGVPFIAPVIEALKQLDRYMNSELMANIVASMLTVFFTTQEDHIGAPLEEPVGEEDKVSTAEEKIELTAGGIINLKPGVTPVTVNPMRQNTAFDSFVSTMVTYIGSALGIPIDVLQEKFDASYSASRAALLEFWREIKMRRAWFIADVCQPIYEAWLSEAVALGRLDCPGFFDDPLLRAAWSSCEWVGSTMGQLNPKDEVEAAVMRVQNGLSTREREAAEINGSDATENFEQLLREAQMISAIAQTQETSTSQDNDGTAAQTGNQQAPATQDDTKNTRSLRGEQD